MIIHRNKHFIYILNFRTFAKARYNYRNYSKLYAGRTAK